jgi:hypothetical protein
MLPFQPIPRQPSGAPIKWCTGEDSNLRSSKERQIYSLLPLTTRPPVPIARLRASAPPRCPARSSRRGRRIPEKSFPPNCSHLPPHDATQPFGAGLRQKTLAGNGSLLRKGTPARADSCRRVWSWRRDLNPRPSDYKSDALPAELRQPEQFPALRPGRKSASESEAIELCHNPPGSRISSAARQFPRPGSQPR